MIVSARLSSKGQGIDWQSGTRTAALDVGWLLLGDFIATHAGIDATPLRPRSLTSLVLRCRQRRSRCFTPQDEPPLHDLGKLLADALVAGATLGQFSEPGESLVQADVDAIEQLEAWACIGRQLHLAAYAEIG